jgi:hypothetical protein
MKEPDKEVRTLSVRMLTTDYETMQCRARAANRSVSDFTRRMLAFALHATRDDPSIVLPPAYAAEPPSPRSAEENR